MRHFSGLITGHVGSALRDAALTGVIVTTPMDPGVVQPGDPGKDDGRCITINTGYGWMAVVMSLIADFRAS